METLQPARAPQPLFSVVLAFAHLSLQVMSSKLKSMARSHQNYGPIQQRLAGRNLMKATIQSSPAGKSSLSDVSNTDSVSFSGV